MRKRFIIVLALILCLATSSGIACGNKEATINEWNAPVFASDYYVGDYVILSLGQIKNSEGKECNVQITVQQPDSSSVDASVGFFQPTKAGTHIAVYVVSTGNKSQTKSSVFNVRKKNGGDSSQGEDDKPSASGLSVIKEFGTAKAWCKDNELTVDGNVITINKPLKESDYSGIAFTDLHYAVANKEQQVKFTVKNNTGATVTAKYKVNTNGSFTPSWGGKGEGFGGAEVSAEPNSLSSETFHILSYDQKDSATEILQVEIFVVTTASRGTIEIGLELVGSQGGEGQETSEIDDHTSSVLGKMKVAGGSDGYFSVSGTTVTLKKPTELGEYTGADNQYKSVVWELKGYDFAKDKSVSFEVTNDSSAPITLKYKVNVDGKDYYVDFESVPSGEKKNFSTNVGGLEVENPSSISKIELFIANEAGSGTIKIIPKLSDALVFVSHNIAVVQVKGATTDCVKTAKVGERIELNLVDFNENAFEFRGFVVKDAEGNDVEVTEENGVYVFVMPDCDVNVTADIIQTKYLVNVLNTKAGRIVVSATEADIGSRITLSFTPNEGFSLNKFVVKNGDAEVTVEESEGKFSFIMPDADVTVSADYNQSVFDVETDDDIIGGTVSATPTRAENGSLITLSYVEKEDYRFVKYVVKKYNGEEVEVTDGKFAITDSDVVVTAIFDRYVFNVNVTAVKGGTITVGNKYEVGKSVVLSFTANSNYSFVKWIVKDAGGNEIAVVGDSFVMPDSDVTVTAECRLNKTEAEILSVWKDGNFTATKNSDGSATFVSSQSWTDKYNGGYVNVGARGYEKITFTITNNSTNKDLKLNVSVLKNVNEKYSDCYGVLSVKSGEGSDFGNVSEGMASIAAIGAGESVTVTVILKQSAEGNGEFTSVRFSPREAFEGNSFSVSDFVAE